MKEMGSIEGNDLDHCDVLAGGLEPTLVGNDRREVAELPTLGDFEARFGNYLADRILLDQLGAERRTVLDTVNYGRQRLPQW